jgi:hypothetical protein
MRNIYDLTIQNNLELRTMRKIDSKELIENEVRRTRSATKWKSDRRLISKEYIYKLIY